MEEEEEERQVEASKGKGKKFGWWERREEVYRLEEQLREGMEM